MRPNTSGPKKLSRSGCARRNQHLLFNGSVVLSECRAEKMPYSTFLMSASLVAILSHSGSQKVGSSPPVLASLVAEKLGKSDVIPQFRGLLRAPILWHNTVTIGAPVEQHRQRSGRPRSPRAEARAPANILSQFTADQQRPNKALGIAGLFAWARNSRSS